jgi:hypothetical protein
VTFGVGITFTPLFQTNFLPDLMQVNLNPFTVDVEFNFVQGPPALATAANTIFVGVKEAKRINTSTDARRRIP